MDMVLHQWGAQHCEWIPKKNIDFFRNLLDENTFRIEILGEWGSASGAVFSYGKIQKALINKSDLPPVSEIDRFYAGIDWGTAHPTVIVLLGMRGSVEDGTDEWFVYYVGKVYSKQEVKDEGLNTQTLEYIWGIRDIVDFYKADTYSEQSAVSAFANRKLRKALSDIGISFKTDSFSRKKNTMVNNLKGCLEHERIKIPKTFRLLISQLQSYSYKMVNEEIREEFKKINDDYTDAIVWARWHEHIDLGSTVNTFLNPDSYLEYPTALNMARENEILHDITKEVMKQTLSTTPRASAGDLWEETPEAMIRLPRVPFDLSLFYLVKRESAVLRNVISTITQEIFRESLKDGIEGILEGRNRIQTKIQS